MPYSSLDNKRGILKWRLAIWIPLIFAVTSSAYISILGDTSFLKNIIPNYHALFDPLAVAVQIIMGLIVASAFFYLGKFHDYRKEFLQAESKFLILVEKHKRLLKKDDEQDQKELSALESKLKKFQEIRKSYAYFPKSIIKDVLIMLGVFSAILIRVYLLKDNATETSFILLIINLIASLAQFLISWYMSEEIISVSEYALESVGVAIAKQEAALFD